MSEQPKQEEPVYPRWRGEHVSAGICSPAQRGLSPLARGTRGTQCGQNPDQRFIPAGAGNTPSP
ncbi:hypothetical protein SEES0695_16736 [Salmonella enterica subsp. enterica serovar Soerenga]|nr:hypothetical protein SEES0695_16736 [Salmonella enterica subsp. enterica serovar Soerenga str. 695]